MDNEISESSIIDKMNGMCLESLDPEGHDAWLKVKLQLEKAREALKK